MMMPFKNFIVMKSNGPNLIKLLLQNYHDFKFFSYRLCVVDIELSSLLHTYLVEEGTVLCPRPVHFSLIGRNSFHFPLGGGHQNNTSVSHFPDTRILSDTGIRQIWCHYSSVFLIELYDTRLIPEYHQQFCQPD